MDRKLVAFLAVARIGNLTAAAGAIGLTQPALTKTIRRLEQEVGAPLFVRSSRGMLLSEMGELFLGHARAIETHWAQAKEEAHARAGGMLSEFSIASGAAYHTRLVPLLLRRLALEFPETRFVMDFDVAGSALPKLLSGEVHLLLGAFVQEVPDGLVTEKLLDVMSTAICSRDDPLARLSRVTAGDMRGRRWVLYRRDTFMRDRLAEYFVRHRISAPQVVAEVDSLAVTMMLVAGTPYLTAAPTTITGMADMAGLALLRLDAPLWTFPSGAWMRRATLEYPILQRSLAILRDLVRTHSAELSRWQD
jgi:DNA-binding transcriptional LysR family regulator